MVWSFSEKTDFTFRANPDLPDVPVPFTPGEKATILAALQTAYDGSSTARTMFENWIAAGKRIEIARMRGAFQAEFSTGKVEIDLAFLNNASYISPTGKAVKDTLLTSLVHELGHALTGKEDNDITSKYSVKTADYRGDNVNFVNLIYKELGLPEQVSYIAYDTSGIIHKLNYQYTNGAAIGSARSANGSWNSGQWSVSNENLNDLLIGGPSANILQSSNGNDFLFGAGGNDTLNGGDGKDTAVYFGK